MHAVIDSSEIESGGEVYPWTAPEDSSSITSGALTRTERLAEGKEEEPQGASSETSISIFTPWTVAMTAFTGNIVQDTEGVEVSAVTEEKNIGSETKPTKSAKSNDSTDEGTFVAADTNAEKGEQLPSQHSEMMGSIFDNLSAAMAALTGSVIQDSEGVEVSAAEENKALVSDAVSTKNMATICTSVDVTTKADTSIEKETNNESVSPKKLSSSKADEECSIFSGIDDDDQDLEKAEDFGTKEGINSEELKQVEDDSSKSGEERSKEEPSDSVGIIASAMAAFMSSVFINDTGDVEVAADPEGAIEECETAAVNSTKITSDYQKEASPDAALNQSLTHKDDVSKNEVTETNDTVDEAATPEDNASSEDGDESVASSTRVGESPNSPNSTGVIAQRQAHLAALAASIPTLDDESKERASSRIASPDTVSKTSFKDKLSSIISRDIVANERSAEESDGSSIKTNLMERYRLIRDSSLIDEDDSVLERDFNDFFKQLDDESVGGETVETELIDSGIRAGCISARTRYYSPPTCRFDGREFDEGYQLKACGATAPACQGIECSV